MTIVGDVHGRLDLLKLALEDVDWELTEVVMLGDYVNRGPDSRGVLEYLKVSKAHHAERLTLLLGNHEASLLRAIRSRSLEEFIALGGLSTIRSYVPAPDASSLEHFLDVVSRDHLPLLEQALPCLETDEILISHCGYDPDNPFDRSPIAMCEQSNPAIFTHAHPPRPMVICGHYVQRSGKPFISRHLACLDTGCGTLPENPLTALRWPAMQVRQYWGELRT